MSALNGHHADPSGTPRRRAPIPDPQLALLALAAAIEGDDARRDVERLLPVDNPALLWSVIEAAMVVCPSLLTQATADQIAASMTRLRTTL